MHQFLAADDGRGVEGADDGTEAEGENDDDGAEDEIEKSAVEAEDNDFDSEDTPDDDAFIQLKATSTSTGTLSPTQRMRTPRTTRCTSSWPQTTDAESRAPTTARRLRERTTTTAPRMRSRSLPRRPRTMISIVRTRQTTMRKHLPLELSLKEL